MSNRQPFPSHRQRERSPSRLDATATGNAGADAKIKEPILPCAQAATGLDEIPRTAAQATRRLSPG